jgi:16S rRNA (cytosine967-C5)-methyltransferase
MCYINSMINNDFPQTAELILKAALMGLAKWTNEHVSLDDYLDQDVAPELRPPVSSMLFEYFRNKALIDRVVASKCARLPKPRYQRLLVLTLTQCLFQSGIRAESAVNVAVDLARKNYGKSTSGFINGVLRNILRSDLKEYQKEIDKNPLLRFPKILQKRWRQNFNSEKLQQMSVAMTQEAPFTFRLTGELSDEELASIEAVKLPGFEWAPDMLFFSTEKCKELFKQDFLATGRIYIQDPATTLGPCMAEIKGGERILDMCAAPGGKTLILAERLKGSGKLVAADRSAKRQEMTRENFENRNLNCKIIVGAAEELGFSAESFDIILLDVPCTNTGVFRHKPDALWRFSKANLDSTLKLQSDILAKAAELIAPGGQIVYSTCSVEDEENHIQIENFLADNPNFELHTQQLLLPDSSHDGAFSAILVKK